jgi:endonuclease G
MRLKMRLIPIGLLSLLAACAAPPGAENPGWVGGLFGDEALIAADVMRYGFPGTDTLRYRAGYVISYDAPRRVPRWVAERLSPDVVDGELPDFPRHFAPDETLPADLRARSEDFADSGYVRGRLAAAANHRGDEKACRATYLLSNAAPQLGADFRATFWVSLERKVRNWARESDHLWVVTGTLFLAPEGSSQVRYKLIGERGVGVPTHFFKVVLRERGRSRAVLAFLVPHEPLAADADAAAFLVSVDRLESLSGLDFFPELGEPAQADLEAQQPDALWAKVVEQSVDNTTR